MKKLVLFLSLVLLGFSAISQNSSPLVVKDFVLKSNEIIDMEQIPKFDRTDMDNNPICRIKVKAQGFEEGTLQKFVFVPKGVQITHSLFKDGMWYLHVSSNKNGEITVKYMGDCVFRLPYQLEPKKVYELTLAMETGTLVIKTIPTHAEIFIDNEMVGKGEAIKAVSIGAEHRYRVVCEDYYTQENVVYFAQREEKEITVVLESNFGFITVKSEPNGADVYVDDQKVGTTPYMMQKITIGNHVVELRKMGYENYAEMVSITRGDINNQLENVSLNVANISYGTLYVTSIPEGADIDVDGVFMGRTPKAFDVLSGTHTIILTKQGSNPASKTVTVTDNVTTNVNLQLETLREVSISTNEPGDKIYVDGDYIGESPLITKMAIGMHVVEAWRGEKQARQSITVVENITPNVMIYIENEREIKITSNKDGDVIFIDGVYAGESPLTIMLTVGSHDIEARRGDKNREKTILVEKTGGVTSVSFNIADDKIYTVNGVSFKMIVVQSGTFKMGVSYKEDKDAKPHEDPPHEVTISEFYIGQTEVTQELWKAVMGSRRGSFRGKNMPVEKVSWDDCQKFIEQLNALTGGKFRLPTEAEWEFAARGGRKSRGYRYSGSNNVDEVAWYTSTTEDKGTRPVATKKPNELGLYDMSGNVHEWCSDYYGTYSSIRLKDPQGPSSGDRRVVRGGSWFIDAKFSRVTSREIRKQKDKDKYVGFRLAADL